MYCQHCGRQVPNDSRFCSCCGAKQVLLSQQKPLQPEYPKQTNVPNQVQPPQPQYSKPNNIPNQVQPPQPQSSVPNSASAFGGSAINKTSGGIKAGQIVGIPKVTFIKIIAVITAAILTVAGSVFIVSNINKKPAKEIIGTWRDYLDSYEMTFRKNGKVIIEEAEQTIEGKYSIDSDNTLEMYFSYQGESVSMEMNYIPLDQVERFENRNLMDEEAMWWYIEDDTLYFNNIDNMLVKD